VGCDATDTIDMLEHIIPEFDHPTELALEHLKVINELKKSCQNSSLPNIRFLWFYSLFDNNQVAQEILDLGLHKLESLYCDRCPAQPVMSIIPRVGHTLTSLNLFCPIGAFNFFEIIVWCPNLKELYITSFDRQGFYMFDSANYIQRTPVLLNLETIHLNLSNNLHVRLPSGVIARYIFFQL